ncbi:MAG TPA: haloacid dehalogenase-like hydrolase [Acidimicrobiales bacterium]|nr:haloacid dehalogenase-like hydrolase [Acidimicrobiales bacterium]
MVERLVLWDIDGTLVRAGKVASEIFATAVEHAVGRHPGDHGVVMSGKTDPQIALEILAGMGLDATDGERHLAGVVDRMERELAEAVELIRTRGRVLAGVEKALVTLGNDEGVAQSVLTGNTAVNAATKLAALGLDHLLDLEIGAYGSDDRDRCALVPVALERAATRRGWALGPRDVWVVGDTANDLACARAGGARCLLVGTGQTPVETLTGLGADAVLDDLSDTEAVIKLLRS